MIRSIPVVQGWDTENERDILGWESLPGAWRIQTTYLIPYPWGPTPGRQVPSGGLKTSSIYKRAQRNWDSTHEAHVYILAYSWEQGRGSKLRLLRALASFSKGPHILGPHPRPAPTSLALVLLPLWDEAAPFQERGECTVRGNGTSSDPTIRVSTLAPSDPTTSQAGQQWPLSTGKGLTHTWP